MLAPLVEAGPRAQVLPKGVEALLDLCPHCPVTVTAVALVVDRRRLVAADAFLPHAEKTPAWSLRLRRVVVAVAPGKERLGPLGGDRPRRGVGGQGGEDRFPLVLVGLRRDIGELHHPEEVKDLAPPGR